MNNTKKEEINIKHLSLFSGIEAFKKALTNLEIENELVGFSEVDKYPTTALCAIHNVDEDLNYGDIKKINPNQLPNFDLMTYGFPCKDISIAGKKKGFKKDSGTKSSLLWYAMNIAKNKKPKYMIAENVKHLVSNKFKDDFDNWLNYLKSIGYKNYWGILNAKNFNIPQNRERVFVISIRKDVNKEFTFPKREKLKVSFRDILQYKFNEKHILSKKAIKKLKRHNNDIFKKPLPNISKTIHAGYYKLGGRDQQYIALRDNRIWKIRDTDYITCLDANYYKGIDNYRVRTAITDTYLIRKLTPLECWRLMGFDDKDYWKARFALEKEYYYGNERSDTRMYKMAGNSIVVSVLEAIFKQLFLS